LCTTGTTGTVDCFFKHGVQIRLFFSADFLPIHAQTDSTFSRALFKLNLLIFYFVFASSAACKQLHCTRVLECILWYTLLHYHAKILLSINFHFQILNVALVLPLFWDGITKSHCLHKTSRIHHRKFSEIFQLKSETFHKNCEIYLQHFWDSSGIVKCPRYLRMKSCWKIDEMLQKEFAIFLKYYRYYKKDFSYF